MVSMQVFYPKEGRINKHLVDSMLCDPWSVGVLYNLGALGGIFAWLSLWGKFGGLHACGATLSYTVPLPSSLANPFVFKNEIEKEGLPRGRTPDLGAADPTPFKQGHHGGQRFEWL